MFGSKSFLANKKFTPSQFKLKKIPFMKSPVTFFSKLYKKYENVYLLESLGGPEKLAQYSFIGFNPLTTIKIKDGYMTVKTVETGEEMREKTSDPLNAIKKTLNSVSFSHLDHRFVGGAVGYISYDVIRSWEKLPTLTIDDVQFPDVEMGIYDDGVILDHKKREAYYYYLRENRLPNLNKLTKGSCDFETLSYSQPKVNVTKEHHEKAVEKAKEYVRSGDIFQVVLSKRIQFNFKGDLSSFYKNLRKINPSPYMYFLKHGDRKIVGSSPEMLVRVENRIAETFPIAGTCPYTENHRENRRLAEELLTDPKERAEHIMLLDLGRNDLGKVSKFGSIQIPEFMKVHQYSHVQHIVSQVTGNLKEDCDCYDALRAVFPAGTVSGAPKVRAMEIIEELEPTRRGPYAGAVGYFSYNGNADFAITIRTLVADKNKAYIQAGGGIVADSVPEKEWFETEHKAKALMKALESSGDETH